jgi:hypothetical protein
VSTQRIVKVRRRRSLIAAIPVLFVVGWAETAVAQNYSGYGQSWSSVYGFGSPSNQSVGLQRADMIRKAENGTDRPIINTNNYFDNRSGYIETNSGGGDVLGNSQIGDAIGQQTYSVGALNTGSTTITVEGSNNLIEANNSATSDGCVDGSIHTTSTTLPNDAPLGVVGTEQSTLQQFLLGVTSGCAALPQ